MFILTLVSQLPVRKPKFPLPDHECAPQGVPRDWTGELDSVEDFDLGQRIIWNAMERTSDPLSLFQMYLSNKLLAFAEANLPADVYREFYWHWRIGDDLELSLNNLTSKVASMVSANLPSRFTTLDQTLQTAMVEAGLCCEEAANQLIAECLSPNRKSEMDEHIPGFNREWLTISGAQTHRETLLARTKVPKESWPQKPAPEPPKLISEARMEVTLRGKPVNQPIVKKFGSPFYETTLMVETAEMTIEVAKTSHGKEKLEAEVRAIMEAGEVQVSGTMTNTAGHNGLKLLVLVDKWFPITEEADAAP